jgi:hypothetical protein
MHGNYQYARYEKNSQVIVRLDLGRKICFGNHYRPQPIEAVFILHERHLQKMTPAAQIKSKIV